MVQNRHYFIVFVLTLFFLVIGFGVSSAYAEAGCVVPADCGGGGSGGSPCYTDDDCPPSTHPCGVAECVGVTTGGGAGRCEYHWGNFGDSCTPGSFWVPGPCGRGECRTNGCEAVYDPAGTSCTLRPDQGGACMVGECAGNITACLPTGENVDCNDSNACTRDSCDRTAGCINTDISSTCDDRNVCSGTESCDPASGCQAGTPLACNDNNVCNGVETCDSTTGCTNPPDLNCSDGNSCTTDSCDPVAGCSNTPNTRTCSDGMYCTVGDRCSGGSCVSGIPRVCADDGVSCTIENCNEETNRCDYIPSDAACDDGNECTTGDTCTEGVCEGTPIEIPADTECRDYSCDPTRGIVWDDTPAAVICDAENPCTNYHCNGSGLCTGIPSVDLDAGDAGQCETRVCLPGAGGWTTIPDADLVGSSCNDGTVCTTGEVCQADGTCSGGIDEGDPNPELDTFCTNRECDASGGWRTVIDPDNEGNSCGEEESCIIDKVCTDIGFNYALAMSNRSDAERDLETAQSNYDAASGFCISNPGDPFCTPDPLPGLQTAIDGATAGLAAANAALAVAQAEYVAGDYCVGDVLADDTPCADTDLCDGTETCQAGVCADVPGGADDAVVCEALDECHDAGVCDPTTGTCSDPPATDGTTCDDGNACKIDEACLDGACVATVDADCNDGDACTTDGCNAGTGCTHDPLVCDDSDACTTDSCDHATGCTAEAIACDDGDACTTDGCNPATGCTTEPLVCDDRDACTTDSCDPATGCATTGVACDDRIDCTVDSCNPATGCVYTRDHGVCDDGNPCTLDACSLTLGCIHKPDPGSGDTVCRASAGACDLEETCTGIDNECPPDGLVTAGTECHASAGDCDIAETCDGVSVACPVDNLATAGTECRRASAGVCDVSENCTGSSPDCPADAFEPATTECRVSAGDCDVAETCNGVSADCPIDVFESSDTVCRTPAGDCDLEERCTGSGATCPDNAFIPPGTECDDSTVCNGREICDGLGACVNGTLLDCEDRNICTDDSCDPTVGCVNTNNTVPCDDGNACKIGDTCSGGVCVATEAADCDDSDACTDDKCDTAAGGCMHAPTPDPAPDAAGDCQARACDFVTGWGTISDDTATCTDSNACTSDVCSGGGCVSTDIADPAPDAAGDCQARACDPATGWGNVSDDIATCTDSNACTSDVCSGGVCVSTDIADPAPDDAEICERRECTLEGGWATVAETDGTLCNDSDACTEGDVCTTGVCGGSTVDCSALADQCNTGECNADSGECEAVPVADDTPCDDSDICTEPDVCTSGVCVGGPPPDEICDDGIDNDCDGAIDGEDDECIVCEDGSLAVESLCIGILPPDGINSGMCVEVADPAIVVAGITGFGGPRNMAVDESGSLYFTDNSNRLFKIDPVTGDHVIRAPGFAFDYLVDYAIHGDDIYVADGQSDETVKVVRVKSDDTVENLASTTAYYGITATADRVYLLGKDTKIYEWTPDPGVPPAPFVASEFFDVGAHYTGAGMGFALAFPEDLTNYDGKLFLRNMAENLIVAIDIEAETVSDIRGITVPGAVAVEYLIHAFSEDDFNIYRASYDLAPMWAPLIFPGAIGEVTGLALWDVCRGEEICLPAEEICDGFDNDCDGEIDEELGPVTCGLGECEHMVDTCIDGVEVVCNPFEGAVDEICNYLDDDCDGEVDEGVLNTCGNCEPIPPEVCDEAEEDEDCDGLSNEGCDCVDGEERPCGILEGECVPGIQICEGGTWGDECVGMIGPSEEVCDGLDNDCDGEIDEGLGTITCGIGLCEHTIDACVDGEIVTCDPMEGASEEICDFIDNDCDELVDEDENDVEGGLRNPCGECGPTPPEICDDETDNDCDGDVDEECPAGPQVIPPPDDGGQKMTGSGCGCDLRAGILPYFNMMHIFWLYFIFLALWVAYRVKRIK